MILLTLISNSFSQDCQGPLNAMAARPLIQKSDGEFVAGPDIGGAIMHYFSGQIPWGSGVSVPIQDLYPNNMTVYADTASNTTIYTSATPTFNGVLGNVLVDGTDSNHVRACTCPHDMDCSNGDCNYSAEVSLYSVSLVCGGECSQMTPDSSSEDPTSGDPTTPGQTEDEEDGSTPLGADWCDITSCEEECNDVNAPSYSDWVEKVLKGKL